MKDLNKDKPLEKEWKWDTDNRHWLKIRKRVSYDDYDCKHSQQYYNGLKE